MFMTVRFSHALANRLETTLKFSTVKPARYSLIRSIDSDTQNKVGRTSYLEIDLCQA